MAKDAATDAIMPVAKLKSLLALSKREPVNAAIGVTADGDGFILLDKKAKPRKVAAMVRASAAKAKLQLNPSTIRFGRAEVDTDYDAGTVRFFINKEAPGTLRIKLIEVVKKIAYQKVELNVDASLDEEDDETGGESGEDQAEGSGAAVAPPGETIPEPPPPPGLDPAQLKRDLAGLMGRIAQAAGSDATRRAALVQLATAANAALKGIDLAAAATAIGQLRTALDGAATTSSAGSAGGEPVTSEAFRAAWTTAWDGWLDAIDTVEAQIDILARVLHASGDAGLQDIADSGLATIFDNHKVRLTGAGMRLKAAAGPALPKAMDEARKAIEALSGHIAGSPKVAVCDEANIGVAVSIRGTLGPALRGLSTALDDAPDLAKAA